MSGRRDCRKLQMFGGQKIVSATAGEQRNPRCFNNLCKCTEFTLKYQASEEVGMPCLANCNH